MTGFGERLRDAMSIAGLRTAGDLAQKCGFSRQTAANLLKLESASNVRGGHLLVLSNCLGVRIRWLLEGDPKVGRTSVFEALAIERATHIIDKLPREKTERWLDCGEGQISA